MFYNKRQCNSSDIIDVRICALEPSLCTKHKLMKNAVHLLTKDFLFIVSVPILDSYRMRTVLMQQPQKIFLDYIQ